jgi:surfeit locus 1 family protein
MDLDLNRMFRLMFSPRWRFTTLLVMLGIVLTIRLGIWQLDRYRQNKAFADHLAAMQAASPVLLSGDTQSADLTGMEYRGVQATGRFDFSHQIAVRNQIWIQSWGNEPGYILVTPLVLADGAAILVDRGWIPLTYDTPVSWRDFDVAGTIGVTGIIRLPARPGMGGQADPTLSPGQSSMDFWNFVDLGRLQEQLPYPILPVYIQQAPAPGNSNLPYRTLAVPDSTPANTNAGFATMWFAFTALLFFGYPLYLRK